MSTTSNFGPYDFLTGFSASIGARLGSDPGSGVKIR